MAEAYCVKDKQKVEVAERTAHHDEERQAGAPGHLSDLRRQGLQDRRLTASSPDATERPPPATAGAVPCPGPGRARRPLLEWGRSPFEIHTAAGPATQGAAVG